MSLLGPPPLHRGTDPLHRFSGSCATVTPTSSSFGSSTLRMGAKTSATIVDRALDLDAEFARLNARYFGGHLPDRYRFVYDEGMEPGVRGYFRGTDDTISIMSGMSTVETRGVLLHELVHAWLVDGDEMLYDGTNGHGPDFQRFARMIDPKGGPRTEEEAKAWRPLDPPGSIVRGGNDMPPRLRMMNRNGSRIIETRTSAGRVQLR